MTSTMLHCNRSLRTRGQIPVLPQWGSLQASSLLPLHWPVSVLRPCQDERANGAVRTTAVALCLAPTLDLLLTLNARYSTRQASCGAGNDERNWKSSSGLRRVTLRISRRCQMYACSQALMTSLLTIQAYFTLLGHHHPTSTLRFARPAAQATIAKILYLHDELLGALYRVVPFAEYDQQLAKGSTRGALRKPLHTRWHSVDIVPGHPRVISPKRGALVTAVRQSRRSLNLSRSDEGESAVVRCAPQIIAAVATVFKSYVRAV